MAKKKAEFIGPLRDEKKEELVVPLQAKGKSDWYVHPGHGKGRFDFEKPPENVGGIGGTRYLFVTKDGGSWYLPLEVKNQGSRWEDAEHAEADWERYSKLRPDMRKVVFAAMWGDTELAGDLYEMSVKAYSFEKMKKGVKKYDTWRSISAGEPKPNDVNRRFNMTDWFIGPY